MVELTPTNSQTNTILMISGREEPALHAGRRWRTRRRAWRLRDYVTAFSAFTRHLILHLAVLTLFSRKPDSEGRAATGVRLTPLPTRPAGKEGGSALFQAALKQEERRRHLCVTLGTECLLITKTQRTDRTRLLVPTRPCHRFLSVKKTKARKRRNDHFGETIKVIEHKATDGVLTS